MKVLILGAGAREQALSYKLSTSPSVREIVIFPGSPAMAIQGLQVLECPQGATWSTVARAAKDQGVDWVLVGPEQPLAEGFADEARAIALPVFGPSKLAAQLESSKAFAKDVMASAGIPTAAYHVVTDREDCALRAREIFKTDGGVVLKASGLASGKGVFVCTSMAAISEGLNRLYDTMPEAAKTVVVEALLVGRECSFFTCLGEGPPSYLGFAVDYKRLLSGNGGPNTGGMGSYAPVDWLPRGAGAEVVRTVVTPLLNELKRRGISYTGCLYTGIMWTANGPQVVEFNARFGDPECQTLCLQDDRDWGRLIQAKLGLGGSDLAFQDPDYRSEGATVSIVLASPGYPFRKELGRPQPLDPEWFKAGIRNAKIFGAAIEANEGNIVSAPGRILTLVARGADHKAARANAYQAMKVLNEQCPGMQFRTDIAEGE